MNKTHYVCPDLQESLKKIQKTTSPIMCANSLQSCPTLWGSMDCSPPGSSVDGILQERTLEWVAISSSRGSSQRVSRGYLILKMNENVSLSIIKVDEAHHCHNRIYFTQNIFLIWYSLTGLLTEIIEVENNTHTRSHLLQNTFQNLPRWR